MGTTVDFRPNIIFSWVDAFNLVEHAREIYPDLDRIIISPSQEEVLVVEADRTINLLTMKVNTSGEASGKISYHLGSMEGYPVIIE